MATPLATLRSAQLTSLTLIAMAIVINHTSAPCYQLAAQVAGGYEPTDQEAETLATYLDGKL